MSKFTNKQQLSILLGLMEANPGIARGFHKGSREEINRFWVAATDELNSAGPPVKNITDWKKVWSDQKKYVRKKASSNNKASKATGGGPNMQQPFSAVEEAIYNLISMKDAVEGIKAKKFGRAQKEGALTKQETQQKEDDDNNSELNAEFLESSDEDESASAYPKETTQECDALRPTSSGTQADATKSKIKAMGKTARDALEAELEIQMDIRNNISKAVTLMKENMTRTADFNKEMLEVEKEKLQEMRRYNSVMEEMLANLMLNQH